MNRWLNVGVVVGLWIASIWAWPHLPDPIPTHFGLDGRPDAWASPTLLRWMLVPTVALVAFAGFIALGRLAARSPRHVKLLGGLRLSDVDAEHRPRVLAAFQGFLDLLATEMLAILALVQWAAWKGAMGESAQGLLLAVLMLSLIASPFLLVVFVTRVQKAMKGANVSETRPRG